MYSSLAAAKAAVIAVGEEIATLGLPSGISPLVFVFTGDGNGNLCIMNISFFALSSFFAYVVKCVILKCILLIHQNMPVVYNKKCHIVL